MPLWASAYFAAYLTFCLWSHVDDFKSKRDPLWFVIAEMASSVFLLVAALPFWLPSFRAISAPILFGFFVTGCAVTLGQAAVVCRRHVSDPELSLQGKLFVGISGSALGVGISAPLLFWGFKASVLSSYAST
jgi:hypothetical protein